MNAPYCTKCGQLGHLYVHCPNPVPQKPTEVQPDRDEERETPTPTQRVKQWRADNPDKYRDYMRRYMRRRRGGV